MEATLRILRISTALLFGCALLFGLNERSAAVPPDQLADTPWPTYQGDRARTGQSKQLGPVFPSGAPAIADVKYLGAGDKFRTSLAVGRDGTIYAGIGWFFCAAKADMTAWKWCTRLRADVSASSPSVAWDGTTETIYLGDRDNTLTAFNTNGSVRWRYNYGFEGDIWTSPAIAPDGTIYHAHSLNIYGSGVVTAVNPNGSLKWKYVIGTVVGTSSPAIDENGIIYIGDNQGFLHAFQEVCSSGVCEGNRLWRLQVGTVVSAAPVIGPTGTIYVGTSGGVAAVRPDGTLLWKFATPGFVYQTPALGKNGVLYFGATSGSWNLVYAINATTAALQWNYGPITAGAAAGVFPIVGADGIVYLTVGGLVQSLRASDGTLMWSYATHNQIIAAPIIGGSAATATGGRATLYVGSSDKFLYAISSHRDPLNPSSTPTADAGSDQTGQVGQSITFNGSGSGSPGDQLSYTWNFGDGGTASGATASHTYWSPGQYTATLTVSGLLASAQDTAGVDISNPSAGPIACSDSFNRDNNAALGNPDNTLNAAGSGSCPLAAQWVEAQGALGIASNELRNDPQKATHIAILPALTGVTQNISAKFASVDNNSAPRFGVILRYQNASNYYLVSRLAGGTNQLRISKIVNGVETLLTWRSTSNVALNSFFRLGGQANANSLSLQVNGVTWLTVSDSTFGGGTAGVYLNTGVGASSYRVDDFIATVQ